MTSGKPADSPFIQ